MRGKCRRWGCLGWQNGCAASWLRQQLPTVVSGVRSLLPAIVANCVNLAGVPHTCTELCHQTLLAAPRK